MTAFDYVVQRNMDCALDDVRQTVHLSDELQKILFNETMEQLSEFTPYAADD